MFANKKSGNGADEDHWPGRLRHATRRFQRYRERFRRHSLRQFHRPGINRPAINHAGANGLAILGDQPQLVALVRRRRLYPPVAHGHAHFRVVHHAHVALGHAGLLRKRDGDRVLRFQQRLRVESFIELLLLLLQRGLLLCELPAQSLVLIAKASRDEKKQNARGHKHRSPPSPEESASAFRLALRTLCFGAFDGRVNLAHQPLSHRRRRLHAGSRECQQPNSSARFRQSRSALRARRHVRFDRSLLFAFQNAEGVKVEVFRPSWMSVHDNKFRFKLSTAVRIRVFTVPSGSPVLLAISLWVNPSKYANSIAARCSVERFPKAPITRPSNCCWVIAFSKFTGTMTVVSRSSSPALGVCRRSRDMARLRAITVSHPGSEPRAGSNCAAFIHS